MDGSGLKPRRIGFRITVFMTYGRRSVRGRASKKHRADQIEHRQADEERRVADGGDQRADHQRNTSTPPLPQVPAMPATVATSLRLNRSEAMVITVTDSV